MKNKNIRKSRNFNAGFDGILLCVVALTALASAFGSYFIFQTAWLRWLLVGFNALIVVLSGCTGLALYHCVKSIKSHSGAKTQKE